MVDRVATIQVLPDDALLLIFSFHRLLSSPSYLNPPVPAEWKWHVLAHVCKRWRSLIFTSPLHLGLRLVISNRWRRTTLDCWPTFPISIWLGSGSFDILSPQAENSVIEALKHSDRIREIKLNVSSSMLEKSTAWVNNSFPALEYLCLRSPHHVTVLPSSFLGGSSGTHRKLRHIELGNISFPTLPQLLLSSPDLVSLSLGLGPLGGAGSLSTEALVAILSTTTQLERLCVYPYPNMPLGQAYPEQRRAYSPPSAQNLIVLSALITFNFKGYSEYLEDLVPRIDMPLIEQFSVTFYHRVLNIPRLSQWISRIERLNSVPHRTSIIFSFDALTIRHCFRHPPLAAFHKPISLEFSIRNDWTATDWQASQVLHICGQLSPFMSSVERLGIRVYNVQQIFHGGTDSAGYLQLFLPFRSVQDLRLWCTGEDPITGLGHALEESTRRRTVQDVLPVLRILGIHHCRCKAESIHRLEAFAAARRRTGRPLILYEGSLWEREDEDTS